jgi:hypothetical protein
LPKRPAPAEQDKPPSKSTYIPWSELLRKTFGFEIVCSKCHSQLRLIALELHPARPPRPPPGDPGGGNDWLN